MEGDVYISGGVMHATQGNTYRSSTSNSIPQKTRSRPRRIRAIQKRIKQREVKNLDELVSEISVIESSEFKIDELIDYMDLWLKYSEYAGYNYEPSSEGGTILRETEGEDWI